MLDPAATVLARLGGIDAVSRELGIHKSRLFRWRAPKTAKSGGTGGLIPQRHHVELLDLARRKDVPMTAADFLPSRAPRSASVQAEALRA